MPYFVDPLQLRLLRQTLTSLVLAPLLLVMLQTKLYKYYKVLMPSTPTEQVSVVKDRR